MNALSLNVRRLVALDMALHGKRFIVTEFAAGVLLSGALGVLSIVTGLRSRGHGLSWQLLIGIALLWIALNYVPLLIHAVELARQGTARQEAAAELADLRLARSYLWRQLWILVPFAVVVLDLAQRSRSSSGARLGGPPYQ